MVGGVQNSPQRKFPGGPEPGALDRSERHIMSPSDSGGKRQIPGWGLGHLTYGEILDPNRAEARTRLTAKTSSFDCCGRRIVELR
jgi:hypothetical protein